MAGLSELGLGKLVRRVGTILAQQLSTRFLQLLIAVYLAHVLGVQEFGRYTIAILWPSVLAQLLSLGLPAASVYALSRGGSLLAAVRWIVRIGSGLLVGGVVLSLLVIIFAAPAVFPGVPVNLLLVATCGFPASLGCTFAAGLLHGKQDFKRYNLTMLINPLVNLLSVLILVGLVGAETVGAVTAWVFGQCGALLGAIWFVRLHGIAERRAGSPADAQSPNLGYGVKAHLSNILTFLNYRIDIFLVNLFLGPAGAGIYTASVRLAEQLWLVSTATAVALLPRLAELDQAEDVRRRLTPLIARWVTIVALLMAFALGLVADWLVDLLFGAGFAQAGELLLWLMPGIVVFSCARILAHDLAARGRPDLNGWVAGITLGVNVVGNLTLIPVYGAIGAAIATTLAYLIATAATFLFYGRLSSHRVWEVLRVSRLDRDVLVRVISMALRKTG